jgi:hypothetical protein
MALPDGTRRTGESLEQNSQLVWLEARSGIFDADKEPQRCVLGDWYLGWDTDICWKSTSVFLGWNKRDVILDGDPSDVYT